MICAPVTWLRQELFSFSPPLQACLHHSRPFSSASRGLIIGAFPLPFISRYLNGPPATLYHRRSSKLNAISREKLRRKGCLEGYARRSSFGRG